MLLANTDMTFLLFEGLFLTASLLWLEVEASKRLAGAILKLPRLKHANTSKVLVFIAINLGLSIFSGKLIDYSLGLII